MSTCISQFCAARVNYTNTIEELNKIHRNPRHRHNITNNHSLQERVYKIYMHIYKTLQRQCTCCYCDKHCAPCLTEPMTRHYSYLNNKLHQYINVTVDLHEPIPIITGNLNLTFMTYDRHDLFTQRPFSPESSEETEPYYTIHQQ
jgi:hypothetical protein